MQAAKAKLNTKLTQLNIMTKRTASILDGGQTEAIERHQATLKTVTAELNQLRLEVEAYKMADKQEVNEIDVWNATLTTEMAKADQGLGSVKGWLKNQKAERENQDREEWIKFEVKLQETKAKLKAELKAKGNQDNQSQCTSEVSKLQAKLPKLVIAKFNVTYADWNRFWGQFSETIDKTSVPAITKFAYLKELLDYKVKKAVEALLYLPEGYTEL